MSCNINRLNESSVDLFVLCEKFAIDDDVANERRNERTDLSIVEKKANNSYLQFVLSYARRTRAQFFFFFAQLQTILQRKTLLIMIIGTRKIIIKTPMKRTTV